MIDFPNKDFYTWEDFLEIVRLLRSENGCPWDRVQTHESIRRNFLEETYEALDALDRDNLEDTREELGDVILQCAFHAQIERERGRFAMPDVIDAVTRKLLYRHPHVFGDVFGGQTNASENNLRNDIISGEKMPNNNIKAKNGAEVLETWEARKRQEKGHQSVADAIEAVPHTLPALWRAEKIQKKVAKAGFSWRDITGALDKLEEETGELREAAEKAVRDADAANDDLIYAPHGVRDEVGDVLFMATKIALDYGIDPEDALHRTCDKFERRFRLVEAAADKPLSDYTEAELVALWKNAKKQES